MSSNENEVSFAGTLTFEDYKKYNFYHLRKMVIGKFFFALILLFIYACTRLFSGSWVLILPVSFIIASIISGFITLLLALLLQLRVRREYKSDQLIKNEITYTVNNKGINQKIKRSNSNYDWDDIIAALEHKEMFRLYISKNKAIIIPKRYFKSNEDIISFKNIIKENLTTKKVKMM